MIRKFRKIILTATVLIATAAAAEDTTYTVTIPDDDHRVARVAVQLTPTDRHFYMFPGANQLPKRWSTFVRSIAATAEDGSPLALAQNDDGSWSLESLPAGAINLEYEIRLDHEDHDWSSGIDGAAYAKEHGVFYTGRALFIANGEHNNDIRVHFELPDGWQVTTPWHQNGDGFFVTDREALSTSMLFAGTHEETRFRQGAFELALVLGGDGLESQRDELTGLAKGVLDYYTELMGGEPRIGSSTAPGRAVVIISPSAETDGEVIGNNISMLLDPNGDAMSQTIGRFIFAHEFFHLWNGKTFAPAGNDAEWFKEGFSNYYTLKALHHVGYLNDESYIRMLSDFFYQRYLSDDGVGRLSMSDGNLKHDHWGLIYSGGLLVAIAQDLKIRAASGNEKSIDDLMRLMYSQFQNTNYSLDDLEMTLSDLNGESQAEFFARYIKGTEAFPIADYIGLAGIRVVESDGRKTLVLANPADGKAGVLRRGLYGD